MCSGSWKGLLYLPSLAFLCSLNLSRIKRGEMKGLQITASNLR